MNFRSVAILAFSAIVSGPVAAQDQRPPADPLRSSHQGVFDGGRWTLQVLDDRIILVNRPSGEDAMAYAPGMTIARDLRFQSISSINQSTEASASDYKARYTGTCTSPVYGGGFEDRACEVQVQHFDNGNPRSSCRVQQNVTDMGGLEGRRCRP